MRYMRYTIKNTKLHLNAMCICICTDDENEDFFTIFVVPQSFWLTREKQNLMITRSAFATCMADGLL